MVRGFGSGRSGYGRNEHFFWPYQLLYWSTLFVDLNVYCSESREQGSMRHNCLYYFLPLTPKHICKHLRINVQCKYMQTIVKTLLDYIYHIKINIWLCNQNNHRNLVAILNVFSKNAIRHIGGSCQPISLILNSKQRKTNFYLLTNFEENRSKIGTVRVPQHRTSIEIVVSVWIYHNQKTPLKAWRNKAKNVFTSSSHSRKVMKS